MGKFVDQIRKTLGLEPKRERTLTGKIPNEVKVNRLQNEQDTSVIPSDDTVVRKSSKTIIGRDDPRSFNLNDNEINFKRREALKRAFQTGAIGENIDTKPDGGFGTSTPMITGPIRPVEPVKRKRKTFGELFGLDTPGGSPKYGDSVYPLYELPPSKKKKYVAEQTADLRSSAFRNSYGVLGELLLGKHLNGGKHVEHHRAQGKTPEEMHDHHATEAFGKNYQKHPEYKRLDEAARLAAEKVKNHLSSGHGITKIKRVAWTSQKSDHKKETGVDDPISKADVIVMGHNGKHVAVSIKTKHPKSETKATNYANHGLKTLSSHAGVDLINDKEIQAKKKAHLELVNKILGPKHVNSSADEKHEAFKKLSKQQKAKIEKSSDELTRTTAKKYADGLKRKLKTDDHHVEHIKKSLGAAGHVHGGDEEKGKTHLPHVVSVIEPSHDNNHNTSAVDIENHVNKTLNNYHKFKVEHNPGSIGVRITAEHKGTGKREVVHQTNVYAGGKKETAQQRTSTIFPAETRKHNMSEEYSLVEHVQSIINEAKNIDIWHAGSHWDPEARHYAQEYRRLNKAMSDIVSDRTRNRPEEYAKHAEQAAMYHRKFKERLDKLEAGKKELSEARGADSKGHKRPTEQGAGLTRKGVMAYRRKNPGSKLSTAVTTPPSKLKPGSKAAKRRKSFCARMSGMPGPMKDEKGRPTRKAMSLRRWNCESSEILKALVEAKKMKGKDPCWKGYEMVGTKEKNGRTVPNCVPEDN